MLKEEFYSAAAPSPWKPWLVAAIAALSILGIAVGLMWAVGLFKIPQNDSGVKTIAAALGLVGSVLGASVALIGTVVKYSMDDRNARLASIESARNYAMAMENEKRNRIDVVIRAVDLLGENNKDATGTQIGGSLLALANLGELSLAVALLAQLWPENLVSSAISDIILKKALQAESEETQVAAATVLGQNGDKVQTGETFCWPIQEMWRTDLPYYARVAVEHAACEWMIAELRRSKDKIPQACEVLYHALEDKDSVLANTAASALAPITEYFPRKRAFLLANNKKLSIADIVERLSKFPKDATTLRGRRIAKQIQELLFPSATTP